MVRKRNKREDSFDRAEKAAEAAAAQACVGLSIPKAAAAASQRSAADAPEGDDPAVPGAVAVEVTKAHHNSRVDKFLASVLPSAPTRSRLQRALRDGGVLLNGSPVTQASQKVRAGDAVEWLRDAARAPPGMVEPEKIDFHIYHEDESCIVLEKPAGMCVHPAGGLRSGTLVNALLHHVGLRSAQPSAFAAPADDSESSGEEGAEGEIPGGAAAAAAGAEAHCPPGAPRANASVASAAGAGSAGAEDGEEAVPAAVDAEDEEEEEEEGASESAARRAEKLAPEGAAAEGSPSTDGGAEPPSVPPLGLSNMASMAQQGTAEGAGEGIVRPGIVHRLDRGTSGVMVVAKTDAAHAALAAQFAAHTSKRSYLALVWGVPEKPSGTIHGPIGRDPGDRLRMTVVAKGKGKPAVTHYSLVEELDGGHASLLRFRLETGRTHQVRVHARHIGHPLMGDETYGGAQLLRGPRAPSRLARYEQILPGVGDAGKGLLARPALHAESLGFAHPSSGDALHFGSPMPEDMAASVALLRVSAAEVAEEAIVSKEPPLGDVLRVTVNKLNGEVLSLSIHEHASVVALKLLIEEQTGLDADQQELLLSGAALQNESRLSGSGVSSETPLQLLMSSVFTFDLELRSLLGPNSPRFGCQTQYNWRMACRCGHSEFWNDVDGYDFYSYDKLTKSRKCPSCGGGHKRKIKRK